MNKSKEILYLAVTTDQYELPLAVEDSVAKLARVLKIRPSTIHESLQKNRPGKRVGYKFIKTEVE